MQFEDRCIHLAHKKVQVVSIWLVSVVILVYRGIKSGWYLGALSAEAFSARQAYSGMVAELFAAVLILWFYLVETRANISDRRLVTKTLNVLALFVYSVLSCILLLGYMPYISDVQAGIANIILFLLFAFSTIVIQRRSKNDNLKFF